MHIPRSADSPNGFVKESPPPVLCVFLSIFFYVLIFQLYLSNKFGFYTFFDELSFLLLVLVSCFYGLRVQYNDVIPVLLLLSYLALSGIIGSQYNTVSIVWMAYEYGYPLISLYYFYRLGARYDFKDFLTSFMNCFFWLFLATMILSALFPSIDLLTIATSSDGPDSLRVSWFFGNPNTLGYVLISTLVFYWSSNSILPGDRLKAIKVVVTIFFIIITSSRSSLLILLILLVFRQVTFGKPSDLIKGGVIGLILAFCFVLFMNTELGALFLYDRIATSKLIFDNARAVVWMENIEVFLSAPVVVQFFGFGPGALIRGDGLLFDSMYLVLLLELGVIGILLLGCVVSYTLYPFIFRLIKNYNGLRQDAFMVISLFLIFCLSGLTAEAFRVFPYNFLFFGMFGLLLGRFRLVLSKG